MTLDLTNKEIRYGAKEITALEGSINKGVINPLSEAEKQGLRPQDIVPPKLVAKNRIRKAGQEPELRTSGPKTPKIATTN